MAQNLRTWLLPIAPNGTTLSPFEGDRHNFLANLVVGALLAGERCPTFSSPPRTRYLLRSAPENEIMIGDGVDTALTLAKRVETKVRQLTHGRIRNLVVKEVQGLV